MGKILVAFEVAVCLLALFAAGLLMRSLNNLKKLDLGYSRENLLMVRADPVAAGYKVQRFITFQQEMTARLASLPGVKSVTGSENGLFSGTESASGMKIEGYTSSKDEDLMVYWDQVGTNHFKALGVPILRGREFGPQDTPTSLRVAVINEAMAKFYFGNSDPIGKHITINDQESKDKPMEIIGVARDMRDHELRGPMQRRFYVPLGQAPDTLFAINFEIRTAGDPAAMEETVRKAFATYDATVPLTRVKTLPELVDNNMFQDILLSKLTGVFGLLALLLACVGLYGVMSYTVSRRTREIGLRMALGSQRNQVMSLILSESMKVVLIGVVAGIPLALLAARALGSILFSLGPSDPVSLAIVVVLLAAVAGLAGMIPALRATKVDPMVALRYE
jgi:predicted permease